MLRLSKKLILCVVIGAFLACGGGKLSENLPAEMQESFDWINQTKATLDQKRAELEELAGQIKNFTPEEVAPADEAAPAEEGAEAAAPVTLESLTAKHDELKKEIAAMTTEFQAKLGDFLYALDTEFAEVQKKNPNLNKRKEYGIVNNMFSAENILAAKEWVRKQGDYKKAIDKMEETLTYDPENKEVQAFLAQLQVDQFMTEERLAKIQRGMTEDEVADSIGMVYRNFKEKWAAEADKPETMAWFYPREDKGIAGVYFAKGANDAFTVFKVDFNAKEPPSTEEPVEPIE